MSSTKVSTWKSLKIFVQTFHDVLKNIMEGFLICQNSYGNTTRPKIFYTSKKISLPFHRQAKQELNIKVAQTLLECSLCLSASYLKVFDPHLNFYGFKRIILSWVFGRGTEKSFCKLAQIAWVINEKVVNFKLSTPNMCLWKWSLVSMCCSLLVRLNALHWFFHTLFV